MSLPPIPLAFAVTMRHLLGLRPPARLGIAVSGGVDSMALALLTRQYLSNFDDIDLMTFTVNHGFRSESHEESLQVNRSLNQIGVKNETLTIDWEGQLTKKQFESRARHERTKLLHDACYRNGIGHLLLAHTLDDQIETFLMRLIRNSSIMGLAGMAPVSGSNILLTPSQQQLNLVRPLLNTKKQDLIQLCKENNLNWVHDRTNFDPTFTERNAVRQLLSQPQKLPVALQPTQLYKTITTLSQKRNKVDKRVSEIIENLTQQNGISIDPKLAIAKFQTYSGFDNEPIEVKASLIYLLSQRVMPYRNPAYKFSSIYKICNQLPKIPSNGEFKKLLNKCKTPMMTLNHANLHINVYPAVNKQTGEPCLEYLVFRQFPITRMLHLFQRTLEIKSTEWTDEWVLMDDRYWIRARKQNENVPDLTIKAQLVNDPANYKKSVIDKTFNEQKKVHWPPHIILVTQPLFTCDRLTNNIVASDVIGYPTLGLYDNSQVEIECVLKRYGQQDIPEQQITF